MERIINKLNPKDRELFDEMENNYASENEKIFFERMRYKQEHIYTSANDLVFHENDNEDALFLIRLDFDEYILSYSGNDRECEECHTQSLSDVLAINLKEHNLSDKDMTLLEWLRSIDYACVLYDNNYDWI